MSGGKMDERIKFVWRQRHYPMFSIIPRSMCATTYFAKITRNNQGNVKE